MPAALGAPAPGGGESGLLKASPALAPPPGRKRLRGRARDPLPAGRLPAPWLAVPLGQGPGTPPAYRPTWAILERLAGYVLPLA